MGGRSRGIQGTPLARRLPQVQEEDPLAPNHRWGGADLYGYLLRLRLHALEQPLYGRYLEGQSGMNAEILYKAATHALLGIITFLAVRIYNAIDHIEDKLGDHETRIQLMELIQSRS